MSQQNKTITDEDILNLANLIGQMNINNPDNTQGENNDLINDVFNKMNTDIDTSGESTSNPENNNINYMTYFYNLFGPDFIKLDKNQQKLKIYQYLIDYLSNLYKI
ncbi:hypothetical protein H8356DRAFT_98924 [Neocallimastix lanati (nom. inval.)]|uniref:Uncharacterized protein n=1 Tax=Neocallimastix californiae TaxID=1754190 RepID=A0A1Y2AUJ6_9FUNG|nr:hypothetical protein H8356DRAFT_98924 [Neocallimastix sp. JGI-2020a]ORY26124.1 hypothetical protein LY90DRAFT_706184 [Neocallimastix californiae]|eukprot:ORY26124.1 hypothetical protein LY90DRAFT_706184 [Neocallimastix californiae]